MEETKQVAVVQRKSAISRIFKREVLIDDETGATAVEYSLLVGLVAVFLIASITTLGSSISETFREAGCKISGKTWTDGTGGNAGTCA